GRVLAQSGNYREALQAKSLLAASLEPDPRAYAKLIEGEIELHRNQAQQALDRFLEARQFADTSMGRFVSGRAYLALGRFTEAYSEFETWLKRNGEAVSLFLDELPTFRYVPPVYLEMARAQEGLHSVKAAESYQRFLAFKTSDDERTVVE